MAAILAAGQAVTPPVAGQATHTVVVGGLTPVATGMAPVLAYSPETITAAMGDVVQFVFMQKNHTTTQSTFAAPCNKMEGGMDSGFMPNPDGLAGVQWNMTVTTTEPLWFYCQQRTGFHCGKGMVFSINAKTGGGASHADFKQLAINLNGTEQVPLSTAGLQNVVPGAQAVPSTVTIQAGGGVAATSTGAAALASATVAPGQGVGADGNTCACSCLCGVNDFPAAAAVNNFGGFAGSF